MPAEGSGCARGLADAANRVEAGVGDESGGFEGYGGFNPVDREFTDDGARGVRPGVSSRVWG